VRRWAGFLAIAAAAMLSLGCPAIHVSLPGGPAPSPPPSPGGTPSPEPAPSPTPIPQPQPSPSPSPTPAPPPSFQGCVTPQGGDEVLLNDSSGPREPATARDFLEYMHRPGGIAEHLTKTIETLTNCHRGDQDCRTGEPQAFFARLTERLRGEGLCAGQFSPHGGGIPDDGIAIAPGPAETTHGMAGLWEGVHVVAYGGPRVAWGKIGRDDNGVYRITGGATPIPTPTPEPEPTPEPTPRPSPEPTPVPTPHPSPRPTPTPGPTPPPGTCPPLTSVEVWSQNGVTKHGEKTLPANTRVKLRWKASGPNPKGFDADYPALCQKRDTEIVKLELEGLFDLQPQRGPDPAEGSWGYWYATTTSGGDHEAHVWLRQKSTGLVVEDDKVWGTRAK